MQRGKTGSGMIRARDVIARYYAVCGLLFLLGVADLLFMIVICFMAKHAGSTKMLLLLDLFALVPGFGLLICWLQMAAVCKRDRKTVCAAAERRCDGTVRLEYQVGAKRYGLELGREKRTGTAGMISVWYDEKNPRNVFFSSAVSKRILLYGIANLGAQLLACAVIHAIFFLFLR